MPEAPPHRQSYAAHTDYVALAGEATEPWQTGLGFFLFILGFLLLPPIVLSLILSRPVAESLYQGTTPSAVLVQFGSMILPLLALREVLRRLHDRDLWSVFGPAVDGVSFALRAALFGFMVLAAQELLPPWPDADSIAELRPILPWILRLPLVLIVVTIQVTLEEMFFRGYLQQQIAARSSNPLLWMGIPTLLFGLAHYANADGPLEGVLWVVWAIGLGLAMSDLTARSGSLGPAIGLHVVNNLFALLLWGMQDGPVSGLALILTTHVDPGDVDQSLGQLVSGAGLAQIALIVLQIGVLWLAGRLAIRR